MRNPRDCPICRRTGATRCPHDPRADNVTQRRVPGRPLSGTVARWTPSRTAFLLKAVLYLGVGAGLWWLAHSGVERESLEIATGEPDGGNYSTLEPEA